MEKDLSYMSNEELWQLFPIIISNHKHEWKNKYNEEKDNLYEWLDKNEIYRISHIGSTAVKGLLAKPTIDILLEINKDVDIEKLRKILEAKNYIYSPQPNNPLPHMMFMKGYTSHGFQGQVYHLHIRYAGDWKEFYFRDYLIEFPEVAKAYGELKLKLSHTYRNDRNAYTEAKTEFINRVTELARKKYGNLYSPI